MMQYWPPADAGRRNAKAHVDTADIRDEPGFLRHGHRVFPRQAHRHDWQ